MNLRAPPRKPKADPFGTLVVVDGHNPSVVKAPLRALVNFSFIHEGYDEAFVNLVN